MIVEQPCASIVSACHGGGMQLHLLEGAVTMHIFMMLAAAVRLHLIYLDLVEVQNMALA